MNLKTANKTSMISSVDVAKILGVNVATVKRWTDSGKLGCVKTAGGHRKFLMHHLSAFARDHEKYAQRLSLIPLDTDDDIKLSDQILHGSLDQLIPLVLKRALLCDQKGIQTILSGLYLIHNNLAAIYDEVLTPVLHQIGRMWMDGNLSISQEHLASQTIRDSIIKLQNVMVQTDEIGETAFVLTLSEELHDIPAKMVQHILELRGFQVLNSGQMTPAGDTVNIFDEFHPDRVYLSTTYNADIPAVQKEFDELVELCRQSDALLYIGGAGLVQLKLTKGFPIKTLQNFKDVSIV